MIRARAFCYLSTLLVAGCTGEPPSDCIASLADRGGSPGTTASRPHTDAPVWDPSLFEGGYMFRDYAVFRAYVSRAEFIAVGTLTQWDGKLKLHSFCGAPGLLYAYSESLVSLVKDALAAVPTLATVESKVKQPGRELGEYGRPFPVVMIPQGASGELESLAKEIAKTIGAASVGRARQNPVCCVWLEINHWTPNPGSPGFIIVNQPGGTQIQASNYEQMKLAVEKLKSVVRVRNGQVEVPIGLITSFRSARY